MIHVVSCFWNAEPYVGKCIESILSQSEMEYVVHMVDDVSSDGGYEMCKRMVGGDSRFRLVKNTSKKYKLKSIDEIISDKNIMDDEDIVVELDGDDHFLHKNVLVTVKKNYSHNPYLKISNGRYVLPDGSPGHSCFVNVNEARHSGFDFSHLRTWRAGLWRSIDKRYFIDPVDGEYFKTAVDLAYSLPMLEAAGQESYKHMEEAMVVYNDQSPLNSHKPGSAAGGRMTQNACAIRIRMLNFGNTNFNMEKIEEYIRTDPMFSGTDKNYSMRTLSQ